MSGTTISNSYVTGISLANAGVDNPVTILAGVTISDPSGRAVYGSGTIDWTIDNFGTVQSHGASAHSYGVALVGGTITNAAGGLVSGGYSGVAFYSTGTVINRGSIVSTVTTAGAAIALIAGGAVANGAGAVVNGAETGIGMDAVGAVTNAGTVLGQNGSGVLLSVGGAVVNNAGGSIIGYRTGVSVVGAGSVVNQGSIGSTGTAGHGYYYNSTSATTTLLDAAVLVTNAGVYNGTAGVISSYFFGIGADQPTTVVNQGQITGSSTVIGFGVFLLGGGSVTNAVSGRISGGLDGVLPTGTSASTVINQGSIAASVRAGIDFFGASSYGSNAATGTITGGLGILLRATGTVINAGSIGGGSYAIDLVGAGTVTNTGSAHLSATVDVLLLAGGTVINQGTMTANGPGAKGVYLDGAGYVTNAAGGHHRQHLDRHPGKHGYRHQDSERGRHPGLDGAGHGGEFRQRQQHRHRQRRRRSAEVRRRDHQRPVWDHHRDVYRRAGVRQRQRAERGLYQRRQRRDRAGWRHGRQPGCDLQ